MKYDINFWPMPDWQRESSINPNFIMAVVIALLVVISIMHFTMAANQRRSTAANLADVRAQAESIGSEVELLQAMSEETELWGRKMELLDRKATRRIFWSRQMAALQQLTPDSVIFTNLAVRGQPLQVEIPAPPPPRGAPRRPPTIERYTVYNLHITAIATGEQSGRTITDYVNNIGNSQIVGEKLESYEIRNIREASGIMGQLYPDAKSFVLHCTYERIPEIL